MRNPKPIYEQIKDNIKQLIVCGALLTDEKLPSVREMAQTTSINPNTIQKAYKDLESEGFIYSVVGRGNFVAASPGGKNPGRIDALKASVKNAVNELYYLGVSKEEVLGLIENTVSDKKEDSPND